MARPLRPIARFAALALLAALAACSDDDNPAADGGGNGGGIETNHTDPASVITAQFEALNARDLETCLALLEAPSATQPGYRFRPLARDVAEFDFLAGRVWDHALESTILANLFDPAYWATLDITWRTVRSVRMTVQVLSTQDVGGGVYRADCACTVFVTFASGNETRIPTGLVYEIATVDGFLRIREVSEFAVTRSGELPDLPPAVDSWGRFKVLFRGDATGSVDPELTDPEDVVQAHAQATSERNLEAYAALLFPALAGVDAFAFYPRALDAGDLPWLVGGCWDRATEIGIMTNMFDPSYASPNAEAVQTIDMDVNVLTITEPGDGTTVVDCLATILVMVGPLEGFLTDTRMLFTLEPYGEWLRIRKIREIERWKAQGGGLQRATEATSWANIEALYRSSG
jgi:hypothetical protein